MVAYYIKLYFLTLIAFFAIDLVWLVDRALFAANPRRSVMVAQCNRMEKRLKEHRPTAERFLDRFHR